mmetsp:Transcript_6898/g.7820  ORF Transcript_6898/g.7820 Transcript_6898/m.7820 type:complete len:92 (+) Transcript_6898:14-289(+)
MSKILFIPRPLDAAWNSTQAAHHLDEDALELEENQFEEELKQIYHQDINISIPDSVLKEEEDEEEEEADDFIGEDMEEIEEYGDDLQLQGP